MRRFALMLIGSQLAGCVLFGFLFASLADASLRAGDHVDLYLVGGSWRRMVVTRASAREVCDETECIPASRVQFLYRRDFIR